MSKEDFDLIKSCLKKASNVFIIGHRDIDLDAFGAALGIYCYASFYKKEAYIILDDKNLESSVRKVIDTYQDETNILKSSKVQNLLDEKSLLIVVDTNKKSLLQQEDVLEWFENIVVIDHHDIGNDSIDLEHALCFIDHDSSSTCEIITKMLQTDQFTICEDVATILLAGIILDTNGFVIKTDSDTYHAAYYLSKCGADNQKVQYLLKQDIEQYIEMQKVIADVKVVKNIAIGRGLQNKVYRREYLAKIADTILFFNNIEASFAIGKLKDGIGISARSMGRIDIGHIMEQFGGGGDNHEGAATISDKSLNQVVEAISKLAKKL